MIFIEWVSHYRFAIKLQGELGQERGMRPIEFNGVGRLTQVLKCFIRSLGKAVPGRENQRRSGVPPFGTETVRCWFEHDLCQ